MDALSFQSHHGRADRPEHGSSLAAAAASVPIEPIRDALEDGSAIDRRKRSDDFSGQHGQDGSYLVGRHLGRRARRRLRRQEA